MRYYACIRSVDPNPVRGQAIIDCAESIGEYSANKENGYGLIWDNASNEDITRAGTNEDKIKEAFEAGLAGEMPSWLLVTHAARLDALTAALPLIK